MLRLRVSQAARARRGRHRALRSGQLDNGELEAVLAGIVEREWLGGQSRIVVEIGTGGGRGSTVAIHRALTASRHPFRLVGYEGSAELARHASRRWRDTENVGVVNEYFMRREDVDAVVKPLVMPGDRAAYLPEFDAIAATDNFLATVPPGPIDLLFVDSVRYTHLAILRAASPWLRPDSVVLMEDDIPGYGELGLLRSDFELRDVVQHEIAGHPWPLVEFRLADEPAKHRR